MVYKGILQTTGSITKVCQLGLDVIHNLFVVGYLLKWNPLLHLYAEFDGSVHIVQ